MNSAVLSRLSGYTVEELKAGLEHVQKVEAEQKAANLAYMQRKLKDYQLEIAAKEEAAERLRDKIRKAARELGYGRGNNINEKNLPLWVLIIDYAFQKKGTFTFEELVKHIHDIDSIHIGHRQRAIGSIRGGLHAVSTSGKVVRVASYSGRTANYEFSRDVEKENRPLFVGTFSKDEFWYSKPHFSSYRFQKGKSPNKA